MVCGLAKAHSPHNSSPPMNPKSKWPKGYSKDHEKLIQLYCKVEPDDIELRDLFDTVFFIGGGIAFPNQEVRRYSTLRKGNILRLKRPPSTVFEPTDFYRSFEQNDIIDTLLALQSQSPPITQTTMSRSTRSRVRTDESVAGDDDVTAADELLTASLRNMNMNVGTRSNR